MAAWSALSFSVSPAGAGAGAAAGAGAQMATKGQRVRVPSEARLTFTLQQAARL